MSSTAKLSAMRERLDEELENLRETAERFPWTDPEAYADWCAQTYYYVCHSTRLLAVAASRFGQAQNPLHLRCVEHIREERSHELLALHDMKNVGHRLEEFPELAATAALYQTQYYRIEHEDPAALFGYILLLEGYASTIGRSIHKKVLERFGKKAVTFWAVHAEEDVDHIESAFEQLKSLSVDQLAAVEQSLMHTRDYYQQMLLQIQTRHQKASKKLAKLGS